MLGSALTREVALDVGNHTFQLVQILVDGGEAIHVEGVDVGADDVNRFRQLLDLVAGGVPLGVALDRSNRDVADGENNPITNRSLRVAFDFSLLDALLL